ncbi:hypothetical protein PIGHUM_01764 [Pigmentiphaga humi]|uniref:TPM domain-containing protein n=1 Tax=Pigmentiphaga humi TaxID=2478468 RepID=A0A3P4B1F2_9BURK|nr:TPM domain-containing protein [Pigmentiphaga humi]VCU69701.1 hypothetical protein PIGHUM_01764 [Pigmentiphaga humi]
MAFKRYLRHLFTTRGTVARAFPPATLEAIEQAIRSLEASHDGEICFIAEGGLDFGLLWRQQSPRERALELFTLQRIWDTEHNNGILLYVQMADHAVEIVCDRGIHACTDAGQWESICHAVEASFRRGRYEQGVLNGIAALAQTLARHYPGRPRSNQLPDKPRLI